ncbi:MAG: hypothetical protein VX988_12855 [Planctomycetota bacterium]|nr:hypothetical protein [Planctomycetota bacterium]
MVRWRAAMVARNQNGIRRRSVSSAALLALLSLTWPGQPAASAASPVGNNSRAARTEATRAIPFDELDADAQRKVNSVLNRTTIYRRLPTQLVECDARYFIFLVRHPEVIVNIWRKMNATEMVLQRKGPESFYASDNAGTISNIEFLYGDHKTHILYCEGTYDGSMTARTIRANCLIILRSEYVRHANGHQYVSNKMDIFLSVKNFGVDLVARAFQNSIGKTTDQNFVETANFVTKLGRTTERNGPGVQRLASQLEELDRETRKKFFDMAGSIYDKATRRDQASADPARVTRARQSQ